MSPFDDIPDQFLSVDESKARQLPFESRQIRVDGFDCDPVFPAELLGFCQPNPR
jgi:hypothetical protein